MTTDEIAHNGKLKAIIEAIAKQMNSPDVNVTDCMYTGKKRFFKEIKNKK